jgi:hypothetical protein
VNTLLLKAQTFAVDVIQSQKLSTFTFSITCHQACAEFTARSRPYTNDIWYKVSKLREKNINKLIQINDNCHLGCGDV